MALEQEVKLACRDVDAARSSVKDTGARLVVARRLLDDRFFDTPDQRLRRSSQALRLRQDGTSITLTWKGPPRPGAVKTREEIEADCGDAADMTAVLGALGYAPSFRSQKYREEYRLDGALVTVDETPFAAFIEVEASPDVITHVTARLGRSAADYETASYVTLWRRWCAAKGLPEGDMTFDATASPSS